VSIRRDYKNTATGPRRRKTARRYGLTVITLILIGLFGGLLAYIKGDGSRPAPVAVVPVVPAPAAVIPAAPPPKPVPTPVAEPAPVKPKYDFYTELPKRQIDVQREEAAPKVTPQPLSSPRTQPVVDPQRKPTLPQRTTTKPAVATSPSRGTQPASAPRKPAQPLTRESTIIVITP